MHNMPRKEIDDYHDFRHRSTINNQSPAGIAQRRYYLSENRNHLTRRCYGGTHVGRRRPISLYNDNRESLSPTINRRPLYNSWSDQGRQHSVKSKSLFKNDKQSFIARNDIDEILDNSPDSSDIDELLGKGPDLNDREEVSGNGSDVLENANSNEDYSEDEDEDMDNKNAILDDNDISIFINEKFHDKTSVSTIDENEVNLNENSYSKQPEFFDSENSESESSQKSGIQEVNDNEEINSKIDKKIYENNFLSAYEQFLAEHEGLEKSSILNNKNLIYTDIKSERNEAIPPSENAPLDTSVNYDDTVNYNSKFNWWSVNQNEEDENQQNANNFDWRSLYEDNVDIEKNEIRDKLLEKYMNCHPAE